MKADLKKYLKAALENDDKSRDDLWELIDVVSKALSEKGDIHDILLILNNVVSTFSMMQDDRLIDEVIRLNLQIGSLITTDEDRAINDYIFMLIYMRLGFAPKSVESALKVISNRCTEPLKKYVAYNELGISALNAGLYEKSKEYVYREIECLDRVDREDKALYYLNAYGNLMLVLAYLNAREELEQARQKILKVIEEKSDDPAVMGVAYSVQIDMAAARICLGDTTKKTVEEYIKNIELLVEKSGENKVFYHGIDTDIIAMKKLIELGYEKECANMCRQIIEHMDSFIGNISGIFGVIDILHKKNNKLFMQDEYLKYASLNNEFLINMANTNQKMINHLVREEFRIYDVNSEYDILKVKYETDSMTGCFNRPSFEMNAESFVASKKDGCLVFMDLDGLKRTNDGFGHDAGDYMLKTFAETFVKNIDAENEHLYRYAGDEFILLTNKNKMATEKLVSLVSEQLSDAFLYNNNKESIGFSYGVVSFDEVVLDSTADMVNNLVKIADSRMYECKHVHHSKMLNSPLDL